MYLPARSREHLQACLYYSRQAPLSVKYRDCSVRDKVHKQLYSQWLLLLPHLGRARSADLEINLANTTETQLILPFSQTLTTLMLTDPFIRKPPALELAGKTIDRIFSVLPNLQHFSSDLHTLGYSDWTERAFPPSLKVLIINHSASGDQTPSLQHLISALQKLPYLRQLQFEGLRSGDYSYSSSNALSMASTPRLERLHLDGHHAPCTSILSRTDYTRRLYLRPRLHLRGNRLVMDLFLDSLTGLFQRQGLPSEESYVLVLHAWAPDGYRLRTHLKVRPAGSGSVIPRKILSQMLKWGEYTDLRHSNSCSRFDIAATVIPKEGRDENWETMRLRRDSAAREFYRRSLPFFPHVQALVIGLDADGYTTKCTWDAVAPLTNNIQSLQIVVKDMPYQHKEPGGRILEFPLKLCEMENGKNDLDNGQVPFPSLRVLSISVPLAVGSKDTTRTFLENLRIALEARKARGYGLMKLMLDVSLEKDQLETQFRHLVEILSMEEDYDWNDSEFE
ncbi:hypothetical protein QCA50_006717 [Cerrena zonata]|uniref:Uncharacterized protein n=1 Tax=Cerrena zonata TaxID=2478898 RepID=A0AAW0GB40_9APHY